MTTYIAILNKERDSAFGVHFPDFWGCITAGETLDEIRHNVVEALSLHIVGMMEDGEAIPAPSPLETVLADPDNQGGLPILVTITEADLEQTRREMVYVTDEDRAAEAAADAEFEDEGLEVPAATVRSVERLTGVKLR